MGSLRLRQLKEKIQLKGDEDEHEQVDSWSNRDLIPLPPSRRTWGWFHFFGYWTLNSLNVSNWQTPNTFLSYGLSVGQSMMVIVVGKLLVTFFSTLIAWCGLRWHIGFTVQNRYTWGLRGSYIPLLQRILLNFIWCAIQCWNGGRLIAVCITAIWPSFAKMHNTLPSSMPTTTYQFVGFVLFWVLSVPFLFVRPEKFRLPFLITSIYCGLGMLSMMIWSLSVAKGVGPLWTTGQTIPENSSWNLHWLEMKGINQIIGGIAAGITNGSDFSRYARSPKNYVLGTVLSAWVTGVLVSLVGLVVTAACQKIYGEVYWNPPDLLMRTMDSGEGSSKARAGVFFLAAGFALTGMFENVCGNAVAGGIDLAGLFPRYLDIRRGAILTFVAVWVCQPWQLVNKAATFVSVLSSFSVFLSPIMGVMVVDFYLLRKGRIQLSHLYRTKDTSYWFTKGVNWRAIPAWICGWAPTIGGLVVTVGGSSSPPRGLVKLYYMAFLVGFFVSGTVFYLLNWIFPYPGMGEYDEVDVYETFTPREAASLGVVQGNEPRVLNGIDTESEHGKLQHETIVEKTL
ncbi:NCS1 nucleoside transporter family protein-like protein [Aureobasidium pullulans]|nr:NCS1 nucleoside transporter family protein-like protein [Aureobasidium pullulans]THW23416.1 NCS1 nucleoside transporter family protein-like protein [Aureobasidium pullulans]THW88177.1 NCS1 nucleoside transporter family protein-like protein [Aureobasidium pullulans]THY89699.1 NCS1 nucleoside transporter family protein-like protein [Aureobasidium pullulans]